jgi:acyl dehydratase
MATPSATRKSSARKTAPTTALEIIDAKSNLGEQRGRLMDSALVPLHRIAGPVTTYCDPDEIIAYAHAINDPSPLYLSGEMAPPTYAAVPATAAIVRAEQIPPEALRGSVGRVHGSYDLHIHKPITPGTRLHTTADRCAVTASKAGMSVTVRLLSHDDAGELTVEQYWSTLLRGPVTGGDQGERLAGFTFPELARANRIGSVSLPTTRDQTFRYAGASGDRTAMHVSDEAAKSAGFPRKFNQGLLTLGVVTRGLIEMTASGDPGRMCRIAVRFAAPSFPGDDLEVSAYEIGTTEHGSHSFAFEAFSGTVAVLRHGRIEVKRQETG